ncbi:peptidase M24, structural domain-containing protein [Cercophora newfieldiana]|uniref:Xaa-Pro aminopeptidase n=1 Tax=Cercophora newfieldiana TaxID=92897 RepID=A0AA39Y5M9_9PEZI|nr:peptidase M24, structural domain-containing protein [Cercophora newfieldiana]
MEVDHDLVIVDEFDALAIEVKVPGKPAAPVPAPKQTPMPTPPPPRHASKPLWQQSQCPLAPLKPSANEKAKLNLKNMIQAEFDKDLIGKYPAKQHAQKVAKKLGVQSGLIFLPGQEEKNYEDSDMGPQFHQRRYFYYISGAAFPGASVTYDIARDHLILWITYVDPRNVLWYGRPLSADQCRAISNVDDVRYSSGLDKFLYTALSPGSTLFVLHPEQTPKLESTKGVVHIDTVKLRPAMDAARVVKTNYEIAMIRRANAISSGAHKAVMSRMRKITSEREVEAIFRGFCTAQGANHQAYPIIAGSGPNAATLHYDANNELLAGRQLLCLDAGAEWDCYASDITRTMPIGGKFTPEAGAIHSIVMRMQNECIQRIKPGVIFSTLHLHACIVAVTELLRLGILHNGTAAEIFNRGTVTAFFPHGLGHHVGLEVHDVSGPEKLLLGGSGVPKGRRGGVVGKREVMSAETLAVMYRDAVAQSASPTDKQRLEKNMVVTIEPGIYFCREYISSYFLDNPAHAKYINKAVLERYYPVGGVRIEDCILVTEDGYDNLTIAPKGEEMLSIINLD